MLAYSSTATSSSMKFGSFFGDYFIAIRKQEGQFTVKGNKDLFVGHQIGEEGTFLQWEWTGLQLVVRNDRYGLCPAYYSQGPKGFIIATSVQRLIAEGVSPELDYDALAVFLRLGTFVGDDTPYSAIRALPPGTQFTWSGGSECPTGCVVLGGATTGLTREAAYERYNELFSEAVTKRSTVAGDAAVALSGGMDSRHILLELCRLGRKPKLCVTAQIYPGESSEDLDYAKQVAQALAVPHVEIEQPRDWVNAEIQKLQATSLGALEHNWGMVVGPYLQHRVVTVFDGLGGDVLSDCRHIVTPARHEAFQAGRFAVLAEDFLQNEYGGVRYLKPKLARLLSRERAIHRLSVEAARFAGAPNPVVAFTFWNRTRRAVSLLPHGVWNRSVQVLTPFLDHTLFDFLIGLPMEFVGDYTFHAETIRRHYPSLAHIPFVSGPCQRPSNGSPIFRKMALDLLTHGLRSIPSSYVSFRHVLPRLMRAIIDPSYSPSVLWLGPSMLYGLELENCSTAYKFVDGFSQLASSINRMDAE